MARARKPTSRSSKRLQEKSAARNGVSFDLAVEAGNEVAEAVVASSSAAVGETSLDDTSGITVTMMCCRGKKKEH